MRVNKQWLAKKRQCSALFCHQKCPKKTEILTVDPNLDYTRLEGWFTQKRKIDVYLLIDPFSVSKHCDVFLWAERSPDPFTNASYEGC